MEKWFILNELILVLYYSWFHLRSGTFNLALILLNLLTFISFKLVYYLIKNKKIKKTILLLIIVYIAIVYYAVDQVFIILLPLNVYLLANAFSLNLIIGFFPLAFVLLRINKVIILEYVLVSGISYLYCLVLYRTRAKIKKLTVENDQMREKIYYLQNTLNKDESYQNEVKELSQLEERNKIAQQLHDNIGHTITGSIMQLEAASALMNKDVEKSNKMVTNSIKVLRQGMEKIRVTLKDIKPSSEQLGLHNLKLLISEVEKNSNLKIHLFYDENIDIITYIQWRVILNNIKEATTNTIKYAKATKINIKFEVLNKVIKVEIKDNGIGTLNIKKGLGIIGMEERTENINGSIIIDGSDGFSVIVLLPI